MTDDGFLQQIIENADDAPRLTMSAASFPSCEERLFASSPVQTICLSDARDHVAAIARCPALGRLRGLQLEGRWEDIPLADWTQLGQKMMVAPVGDQGAKILATSPHLKRLRYLNLSFAGNPLLELARLNLSYNNLGDAGTAALARVPFVGLRQLYLGDNQIGDAGACALAASPHLKQLTHLVSFSAPLCGRQTKVPFLTCVQLYGLRQRTEQASRAICGAAA